MTLPNACPKFKDGRTLSEERAERRRQRQSFEQAEKAKARRRDQPCRWPHCDCHKLKLTHETAHLNDKGMGGDHGIRSTADQMVYLCRRRHQGPRSLHSGHLEIEALTPAGANGALAFYDTDTEGRLYLVAQEDGRPFVYVRD